MKDLLEAIQAALQTALRDYCRSGDIFITPDEDLLPHGVRFPAVGLKDGQIRRRELTADMREETLQVRVVIFQKTARDIGATIVGDAANRGVLEIAADIDAVLDENTLDLAGMLSAMCTDESASQAYLSETDGVQKKVLTYTYEREAERP